MLLAVLAVALIGATPSLTAAGWRSADRRQLDDDANRGAYEDGRDGVREDVRDDVNDDIDREPHQRQLPHDYGDDMRHGHRRDGIRESPAAVGSQPATQPYWGTMRPYWNANQPAAVLPRGARTRGLKK